MLTSCFPRGWPLISALTALTGLAGLSAWWPAAWPRPLLVVSRSLPRGLYLHWPPPTHPVRGMLILFPLPAPVAPLVYQRGWLPRGVPLMKTAAALAGDAVCVSDTAVTINGRVRGPVFLTDRQGRPLPHWRGCVTLGPGEVLPLSTFTPRSFDGRYFGPMPTTAILGEGRAVWIW